MGTVILWLIVIVVMGLLYRDFLKKKKMEQHRWSNWKICYELFKEKLEQLRGWLFLKLVPPDYYKRSEQLLTLEEIADRIDYFNAEEKKIKNSLDKTKLEEEKVKLSFEAIQKKLFKMRSL
jgi:hypothetical protein